MLSLRRLGRKKKKKRILQSHFEFAYLSYLAFFLTHLELKRWILSYTPVVPSKTIPDSRPKWVRFIPVFRTKPYPMGWHIPIKLPLPPGSRIWIPSPIPPWLPIDWAVRFPPISAPFPFSPLLLPRCYFFRAPFYFAPLPTIWTPGTG